ncbi:sensor domain-containing diguanylate cyclase [Psychromonas sp. 14N.309.X.WAT.B.A12]|uniref:sensor domain-containing diguanylate cyclase n=1 Tax=Psychromonas sp. 14N.309.X.WAT.B.A12 TaxID=2998322 RepID=UPI0025AF6DF8|nr:sensor domain-containing diguanylate cyclase [Psychromonas sp. 14N.309.X.WAT.B.A12]MDN2661962.1 sensor domain-containing diguanylate cyclase [Psychromonas sp. 14N.309.X.WAT.B.A12]
MRTKFLAALADKIPAKKIQSEGFITETLKNNISFTDFFPQGFAVIQTNGEGTIAEYPVIPGRKNLIVGELEWFIKAKNSPGVIISSPFRSRVIDDVLVVIATALRDESGKVLGVLVAPIFLNRPGFMAYIFDKDFSEQSDILVVSRKHQLFLASSNPNLVLKATPIKGTNRFLDEVIGGFNGYGDAVTSVGDKMLAATSDINSLDWFVMISTPLEKVYKIINKSLRATIFNGVIVSFFVFLAIMFFLSLFFNPLKKAAESVRQMVLQKRSLSHIKGYKKDEIGDLIIGFNAAIDMVNERNDKLEKSNVALESLSQIDSLTEVFNRRWLDKTLNHLWLVKARSQQPLTLLLIDIDYFKKFNDTYGHIAGDNCLKQVAKTIQKTVSRPTDFLSRYGGEEFVILLESDIEEGALVAEKIRLAISNLNIMHSESLYKHVTISVGVASVIPQLAIKPVELIKHADSALYQSKEHGRNRFECHEDRVILRIIKENS